MASPRQRSHHGQPLSLEALTRRPDVQMIPRRANTQIEQARRMDAILAAPSTNIWLTQFGYLFDALQDQSDLQDDTQDSTTDFLRPHMQTVENLIKLGQAMISKDGDDTAPNSPVPSAFTFFGQFVDHDLTRDVVSDRVANFGELNAKLPVTKATVIDNLMNLRTAPLDLDSVYAQYRRETGPGEDDFTFEDLPRDPANMNKLLVDNVLTSAPRPTNIPPGNDRDLPREPRDANPRLDRTAKIGDARNDENLLIAQMHLALLKAHNALVDMCFDFATAKSILTKLYQWVILHDFLPRIADPKVVNDVLANGNRIYVLAPDEIYMPLEFSVAAFRFGHTMVRAQYDHNSLHNPQSADANKATLLNLFKLTALSGQLGDGQPAGTLNDHLPQDWLPEWNRFLNVPQNHARAFDTQLVEPLADLQTLEGISESPLFKQILAIRNLLRGYKLRIPTGQAVARESANRLGIDPTTFTLTEAEIQSTQAAQKAGAQFMVDAQFTTRSPLWFYLLAEAEVKGKGAHMGPLGSYLIAEVLYALIRRADHSILSEPGWTPASIVAQYGDHFTDEQAALLGTSEFSLAHLLQLAGVF